VIRLASGFAIATFRHKDHFGKEVDHALRKKFIMHILEMGFGTFQSPLCFLPSKPGFYPRE
jgi:hypothetical protein